MLSSQRIRPIRDGFGRDAELDLLLRRGARLMDRLVAYEFALSVVIFHDVEE
jgi:hypothetical protein